MSDLEEKGFKELTPVDEALETYLSLVEAPVPGTEVVGLHEAVDRFLASEYLAPRDSPHYDRSAMDGFAVEASDTVGASPRSPVELPLSEVESVHTGSAMPEGKDAVVKIEETERVEGDGVLRVEEAVTPGENVGDRGEDVEEGTRLYEAGRRVEPSDVSLMRALGTEEVEVRGRPEVSVIPTGEELVEPGKEPGPGQMVESNGILMGETVEEMGGEPRYDRVLSDEPGDLESALDGALESDLVLFSGGSSVGRRDNIVDVLEERGEVVVHGLALAPGKPTALCLVEDTPVMALPGYPAATAVALQVVVRPVLMQLLGGKDEVCRERAVLSRKIYSTVGKRSYSRVKLEGGEALPLRTTGAGILSSIALADGYVVTEADSEGLEAGSEVEVLRF